MRIQTLIWMLAALSAAGQQLAADPARLAALGLDALPAELTFAHEDREAYPWVYPDGSGGCAGIDLALLALVGERAGIAIKTVAYPWQRCLEEMKAGRVDGAFASSYKIERVQYGLYPFLPDGSPDTSLRIHYSGYSLYYRKDRPVGFDGSLFTGITQAIGAQRGFSIVSDLAKFPVTVDSGSNDPVSILKKLAAGWISAAAIQAERADFILASDQALRDVIAKVPTAHEPFLQKTYFLMISRQTEEAHPGISAYLWSILAEVRESPEFAEELKKFYAARE